jgi:predicted acetyltransferase
MTTPAVTLVEANLRIARLCKQAIPAHAEAEALELPLDADIVVEARNPGYTHISLVRDGTALSWCGVVDLPQQIGPCVLRMGGIAGVGTHDDHRFQGHSRRVLTNALRWMRGAGYDVSMLYGISGYYPKYGYAEAFPSTVHTLAVRDAERGAARQCRLAPFGPEHVDAVLAWYHAYNAGRTGVTRRDPRTWTTFRKGLTWGSQAVARVLLDRGAPVGYLVHDAGQETAVLEMAAAPRHFPALLRALVDLAWGQRAEALRLYLADDDPFVAFCRPLGLRTELTYRSDGGAMVRMIHAGRALEKLLPLLATRVAGRGRLTLCTNLDTVGLAWGGGALRLTEASGPAITLPQWALAQLVYGYLDVPTLAVRGSVAGPRRALDTLARFFPPGPHFHYATEYF